MDVAALLIELYGRSPPLARDAVDGTVLETLTKSPSPGANTIAWLVWHSARVQDHHVAELIDADQIWIGDDWARGFGLDPDPSNTGYGHGATDIVTVRPERPEVLLEYLDAVDRRTHIPGEVTPADRPTSLGSARHARQAGQRGRRLPAASRAGGLHTGLFAPLTGSAIAEGVLTLADGVSDLAGTGHEHVDVVRLVLADDA
jgi:hypothetical protein